MVTVSSLTKLFTAVAILQLEETGELRIDDPVSKHLPFFQARRSNGDAQEITLRQLMSHSAGLGDIGMSIIGWIHYEGDEALNQIDLLKSTHTKYSELDNQPGLEGRYSNFGYILLAGVIEAVTGETYEAYIKNSILNPLKMEHTDFVYTKSMESFEAAGSHPKDFLSYIVPIYIDTEKAVREDINGILWFNRVYSDQKGATGLIGSTKDMTRFMRAMLRGGELEGVRILSRANVSKMQQPVVPINDSPAPDTEDMKFGLAWFIGDSDNTLTLTHGGAGMAFVTMLRLYPEKDIGVVVFANSTYLGRAMGSEILDLAGSVTW